MTSDQPSQQTSASYRVLARKCRPQTFAEVVGQQHVTRTLANAISEGRLAHAFLFSGERGVGKTSVARILAKALNCHGGPTETPCDACASCTEIAAGSSLDVHEIDGASNNSVEDVRTLRENVKYMPSRDRFKIYIIDEVHMLSTSAFNALLKTLEEPPQHVKFIFATTEPHKIPDTINSRCLRLDFKRIPLRDIAAQLETIAAAEKVSISARALHLIAREAEGSMRDAQTMLERAISYCGDTVGDEALADLLGHVDRSLLHGILEGLVQSDAAAVARSIGDAYSSGVDLHRLYYGLVELLRDVLMTKTGGGESRLIDASDDERSILQQHAESLSHDDLLRCLRLAMASEPDITRSQNPRIALEVLLLEMVFIRESLPIDEVMTHIDALARQGTAGARPGGSAGSPPQPKQQVSRTVPRTSGGTPDAEALLQFIKKKSPPMAGKLSGCTISIDKDAAIRLMMPEGSFFAEQLKETEELERLTEWCSEFFGRDVRVAVSQTRMRRQEADRPDPRELKKKARDQALHNPVIQKVMETFNGQIIEIRTDL